MKSNLACRKTDAPTSLGSTSDHRVDRPIQTIATQIARRVLGTDSKFSIFNQGFLNIKYPTKENTIKSFENDTNAAPKFTLITNKRSANKLKRCQ